jgi:cytochrome c2
MTSGPAFRFLTRATLLFAAVAGVTVWSLASPAADPVGDAVAWAASQQDKAAAWYAHGPLDAQPDWRAMQMQVPGGDAARGRILIKEYGCGACHTIPGVAGAQGTVGPSLTSLADRAYIAGILTNSPGELTRWLMNPPLFAQDTAMPDLGVTQAHALDMTAYLMTLGNDR